MKQYTDERTDIEPEAMTVDDTNEPRWKRENERLRDEMELPEYEPPRFQDGTYTYRITRELESKYCCDIKFRGKAVRYKDPWEVLVDQEPVMTIDRRRDSNGNTVYLMDSDEFRRTITGAFTSDNCQ